MTDTTDLAARLREIVDDPSWSGIYRAEAKSYGAEGLAPASLADDDVREALRARIMARGAEPVDRLKALDRDQMRAALAHWLATGRRDRPAAS